MNIPHFVDVPMGDRRPTLQMRDQNIFRPLQPDSEKEFAKRAGYHSECERYGHSSSWCPPLYRNTSLLSSPSSVGDRWADSRNPSNDENSGYGMKNHFEVPVDFRPPRHSFSTCSKDEDSSPAMLTSDAVPLRDCDIVCGRGANTMTHPGNQDYRTLVKQHEAEYICAKRSDKPVITMRVMDELKSKGVRFVRREKSEMGLYWVEIGETKIYEKICQSLREGAPELRRKVLASSSVRKTLPKSVGTGRPYCIRDEYRDHHNYSPLPCY